MIDRWSPILTGAVAEAAWAAVRAIAEDLATDRGEQARAADIALFWAYLAGAVDDAPTAARHEEAVDRLVSVVERGVSSLRLYGGLAGIGWTLAHISEDNEEFLAEVDHILVEALDPATRWPGDYDLIGGLAGLAVYFLERPVGVGRADEGLARIVAQLEQTAEVTGAGTTWHTPPSLLPPWQVARWPAGYYSCGLAHGVPGVVAVLGRIAARPGAPARAAELVRAATRWVLAQRVDVPHSIFPGSIEPGQPAGGSRTAWCYGDPGVIAGLWLGRAHLHEPVDDLIALARQVVARAPAHCGVRDAGLCHGSIGLAHVYNRFYQASGDDEFRAAAVRWFEHGLAQAQPGQGVGGFRALKVLTPGQPETLVGEPDFLEGAAGIGLALLAGLQGATPGWDRLLACDVPTRDAGVGA